MRIISVVPSLTELVWDLGLGNELVGITRFCIHPKENLKGIKKVGGTKTLNIEAIKALNPDLIIANKEENSKSDIVQLMPQFNVLLTDIYNLEDSISTIIQIGELTGKTEKAKALAKDIRLSFRNLITKKPKNVLKVAYVIWKNPLMVAGNNTFINDMLDQSGFINAIIDTNSRYPEISKEELIQLNPDLIFLSSEPYPFKNKDKKEFELIYPNARIVLVDGEMFSWYGSRLALAPNYFEKLIDGLGLN
ncbi:MAG: ABC transporter substrate-binding protein [Salibacteraceae bacterium]